jgi:hypothetical protein
VCWSRAGVGLRGGIKMIIGDEIGVYVVNMVVVLPSFETVSRSRNVYYEFAVVRM